MVKVFAWFAKIVGLVVVVSTVTVITTGLIVNSYIDSVLKKFNIQLEGTPFALSQLWGGASTTPPKKADDAGSSSTPKPQGDAVPAMGGVTAPPAAAGGDDAAAGKTGTAPAEGGAAGATGADSSAADQALPNTATPPEEGVVISRDEIAQRKDQLSSADKDKLFLSLMAKIPAEEMQKISTAVEDGLTETELQEVEQIIAKYVSSEEYDKLIEMLKQY
ncbi:hypothetical protein BVG16_08030 [Paenibacillus selenitireducens]|uniref:Spore coat protein n=1 Tax=Paenibacillus selenitireducens TaxID=1324314 RepID=A0A1T2XGV7_9BACL|nr:hypothetical protein [Paenibacillus selenitireducens]OPA79042.1 hypothetical protein BVG16_08030 [Paenibacillus selenitireducens]